MALFNFAYFEKYASALKWADKTGAALKNTTLSDTSVSDLVWMEDGSYFFTSSPYSTGRIEKWARDGTVYYWRHTGIDRTFVEMKPDSAGNLYVASQDDIWILDSDDGTTNYSNIGSDMSGYSAYGLVVDSSGNAYVLAQENSYTDIVVFIFDNTLTYQSTVTLYTGYYNLAYVGTNMFAMDSSGNYFLGETSNNRVHKYNSSGTEQWYFAAGSPALFKLANGKVYVLGYSTNNKVWRLTDNGGSYSEDWDSGTALSGYSTGNLAVTSDEIYIASGSASFDITALDESDGSALSGWTDIDVSNVVLWLEIDPLVTLSCGALSITEEIQFDRWVKTSGYEISGPFEITEQNRIRGFGDALIDKVYSKGNYSYIGTPSPRYENFYMVGDPPSEENSIKSYSLQTGTYDVAVDNDFNVYVKDYRPYTAEEASAASEGYYTSANSYFTIRKYNSEGVFQWTTRIPIGPPKKLLVSVDQQWIYSLSEINSVSGWGCLERWSTADGSRNTDGNWPFDPLDQYDDTSSGGFIIGRDGYLYFTMRDDTDDYYYIYKFDGDLNNPTGWSSPYQVPAENLPYDPAWLNSLDVNSDGYLLICTGSDVSGEYCVRIVEPDQTPLYEYEPPSGEYGAHYGILDDDLNAYVRIASGGYWYTYCIEPGETNHYDWTYTWRVAQSSSTGEGAFMRAFPSVDVAYAYYEGGTIIGPSHSMHKIDLSDGSEVYALNGDDDTYLNWAGIAPYPVAAWGITVTFGSNGVVKTWYDGDPADSAVTLTSGDVVYAEAGRDMKFMFVGDTGYYVDEVTVDSVNLGYRADYTFENVLYRHTLYVTFGTGFPSGPFTMTYEMTGGLLETLSCGHLSESYTLTLNKLNWYFAGGPLEVTEELTGYGYMTFAISLLMLINAYRSDNSVGTLEEHDWLVDGAEYAVADMIANGTLTLGIADIMGEDGANYLYEYASALPSILDVSFTPEQLFDAWIANEDAEAVILNSNFEDIGIYVEEYDGDNYVFVLFAKWAWWKTAYRLDERLMTSYSIGEDMQYFEFMSEETYADFVANSASVFLPRYRAKIGEYVIPNVTSFTYRLETDVPSSLVVHALFDIDVFNQIKDLQDEGLTVESIVNYKGVDQTSEVITVDFTTFSKFGGEHPKLAVGGYSDLLFYTSTVALQNVMTRTKDEQGKTRFRCAVPDFYVRPGHTVTWGQYSITAEKVVIFVSDGLTQYMEVTGE